MHNFFCGYVASIAHYPQKKFQCKLFFVDIASNSFWHNNNDTWEVQLHLSGLLVRP